MGSCYGWTNRRFKASTVKLSKDSSACCYGTVMKPLVRAEHQNKDVRRNVSFKVKSRTNCSSSMSWNGSRLTWRLTPVSLSPDLSATLLHRGVVLLTCPSVSTRTSPLYTVTCVSWCSRWLTGGVSTASPSSASSSGSPSRTHRSSWWATRATLCAPGKSAQKVSEVGVSHERATGHRDEHKQRFVQSRLNVNVNRGFVAQLRGHGVDVYVLMFSEK